LNIGRHQLGKPVQSLQCFFVRNSCFKQIIKAMAGGATTKNFMRPIWQPPRQADENRPPADFAL
jgi:hypothetical protein